MQTRQLFRPFPHTADCNLAKKMFDDGYEIATHTANHIR